MIHCDVFFTPSEFEFPQRKDDVALVGVDILRAGTTICTALRFGAKQIIPVASTDEALNIYTKFDKSDVLLVGERNSQKIDGFHLGNSPLEFTPELVSGKVIIMTTTNGTMLFNKCLNFQHFFVGAFVNFSSVVERVSKSLEQNVSRLIFACGGQDNRFALEDALFCGKLIETLIKKFGDNPDFLMNDGAIASLELYRLHEVDLVGFIKKTSHARQLIQLGFEKDIDFALAIDSLSVVPSANGLYIVAEKA
ncbi:MAG: 2-phosphosulfolactate phosphatase [Candidatus Kapaibacteriota bacterium]